MTYGKDAIDWRRARVLELDSQGYTHREIVSKLQIAKGTVSNDMAYLRKHAQENLQHHVHETIPEEYQKCMMGMKHNLKQILEIGDAATDPRIKLESRRIANDCFRYIMDNEWGSCYGCYQICSGKMDYLMMHCKSFNQMDHLNGEEK